MAYQLCRAMFLKWVVFYVNFEHFVKFVFCHRLPKGGGLLGSMKLVTNVLELHFVMLANHNQNVLVLFRLAQSMCFYVKLESSYCRNLLCKFAWLDRSRIRLDRSKVM